MQNTREQSLIAFGEVQRQRSRTCICSFVDSRMVHHLVEINKAFVALALIHTFDQIDRIFMYVRRFFSISSFFLERLKIILIFLEWT